MEFCLIFLLNYDLMTMSYRYDGDDCGVCNYEVDRCYSTNSANLPHGLVLAID